MNKSKESVSPPSGGRGANTSGGRGANHIERIELRSEKMREVIGPIPRRLVWTSIALLILLAIILVIALMMLPSSSGPIKTIIEHI